MKIDITIKGECNDENKAKIERSIDNIKDLFDWSKIVKNFEEFQGEEK
jgi:hypothetical protein